MAEQTAPMQPTSLASALGSEAATPINPAAAPTMPAIPAPAPEPGHRRPEPATGEREPAQELLGKTSPPAQKRPTRTNGEKTGPKTAMEMLGLRESPKKELDRMAKALREGSKNDIPLKEPEAKPAKPASKEEPPKPEVVEQPSMIAKPEPEAKIKIGDEEKTAAEWQKHFAELKEKASKPAPVAEKKTDSAQPEKKPEEIEAEQAAARKSYIEKSVTEFKPEDYGLPKDVAEYEDLLIGGQEGFDKFTKAMAAVATAAELRTFKRLEKELNPALKEMHERLGPVTEREQQIRAYEREQKFFEANQDLKPFVNQIRDKAQQIRKTADFCENAVAAGIATPEQQAYAETVRSYTPEEFDTEVARQARLLRDQWQSSPSSSNPAGNPTPQPAPAKPAPPARPKPPTGQVPAALAPTGKGGDPVLGAILGSGRM